MSEIDYKKQVALWKSMKHGYCMVSTYREGHELDDMVRISEPVEVQFQKLTDDAVIHSAIASLDAEERKARVDLERKLADIRDRKNQLMALTHQTEAA